MAGRYLPGVGHRDLEMHLPVTIFDWPWPRPNHTTINFIPLFSGSYGLYVPQRSTCARFQYVHVAFAVGNSTIVRGIFR